MREETFDPPKDPLEGDPLEILLGMLGIVPPQMNENRTSQSNSAKPLKSRLETERSKVDHRIRAIKKELYKKKNNGKSPTHDDLIRFSITTICALYFRKKERKCSKEMLMSLFLRLRWEKMPIEKIKELYNFDDISEVINILLEIRRNREKLPLECIAEELQISTFQLNEFIDSADFLRDESLFLRLRWEKMPIEKIKELYNFDAISEVKNILLEIRQNREKLPLECIAEGLQISTSQLNEFIDSADFLGENEV